MGKRRKKKQTVSNRVPQLREERYRRILQWLIGAQDASHGHSVFYDLGPGERPDVVLAHFKLVAKREGFDVAIGFTSRDKKTLSLVFAPVQTVVEVVDEGEEMSRP